MDFMRYDFYQIPNVSFFSKIFAYQNFFSNFAILKTTNREYYTKH